MDVTFKVISPDGWRFDTTGWSAALKDFLKEDDSVIKMEDDDLRDSYNQTIGDLDSFKIKKGGGGGDDDDDSPGFGLVLAVAAATVAAFAVRRRR